MRFVSIFKKFSIITHLMMFSDTILHRKTKEAVIMKKIKIKFTNERIIHASGIAVMDDILAYDTL